LALRFAADRTSRLEKAITVAAPMIARWIGKIAISTSPEVAAERTLADSGLRVLTHSVHAASARFVGEQGARGVAAG
jgi:hypothetical protein